jgi:hypothetical protein
MSGRLQPLRLTVLAGVLFLLGSGEGAGAGEPVPPMRPTKAVLAGRLEDCVKLLRQCRGYPDLVRLIAEEIERVKREIPAAPELADAPRDPRAVAMIRKAADYLRGNTGVLVDRWALIALALYHAGDRMGDEPFSSLVRRVQVWKPPTVYGASLACLLFAELEAEEFKAAIRTNGEFLVRCNAGKAWDYMGPGELDPSNSQFALLGLWIAGKAGFEVPERIWRESQRWFLSVRTDSGGWRYREKGAVEAQNSMTAAGVFSLLVCQAEIQKVRLRSVMAGNRDDAARKDVLEAADKALGLLPPLFDAPTFVSRGYFWFTMERLAAVIERDAIAGVDWYEKGMAEYAKAQRPDGSFAVEPERDKEIETAFAILFLSRQAKETFGRFDN